MGLSQVYVLSTSVAFVISQLKGHQVAKKKNIKKEETLA